MIVLVMAMGVMLLLQQILDVEDVEDDERMREKTKMWTQGRRRKETSRGMSKMNRTTSSGK